MNNNQIEENRLVLYRPILEPRIYRPLNFYFCHSPSQVQVQPFSIMQYNNIRVNINLSSISDLIVNPINNPPMESLLQDIPNELRYLEIN